MTKVKYPNGRVVRYQWVKGKFGYIRDGNKVLRYHLPKPSAVPLGKNEKAIEPEGEVMDGASAPIR